MHFIIAFHKASDQDLDKATLRKKEVCAYVADEVHEFASEKWSLFVYTYNFPFPENIDRIVKVDGNALQLNIGVFEESPVDVDFSGTGYFGDYLVLQVDDRGNGSVTRPFMSYLQCFLYEHEENIILSSEIGLIMSAIRSLSGKRFSELYDYRYIREIIHWGDNPRRHFTRTVFSKIRRVLAHQDVTLLSYKVSIKEPENLFEVDRDIELLYLNSRKEFYDLIFESIIRFVARTFSRIHDKKCVVRLTGGLDSRCVLVLLLEVAKREQLEIHTTTTGPDEHPDVEIARQISIVAGVEHSQYEDIPRYNIPRSVEDYQRAFLLSQGDWSSILWRDSRDSADYSLLYGQDCYKRTTLKKIAKFNRWLARRAAGRQNLPVLCNDAANLCAMLYGKHDPQGGKYEFVYELLKRYQPKLLEIPFAGQALPMHWVKPYKTFADSKTSESKTAKAFYDEELILQNLPEVFYRSSIFRRRMNNGLFLLEATMRNILIRLGIQISPLQKSDRRYHVTFIDSESKRRRAMDFACSSRKTSFI